MKVLIPAADYKDACDKIREKTDTTDLIKSGELADKIEAVYENGKTDKDREMWDVITSNNTRTDYYRGFLGWGCEYIRPPYTIKPTSRHSASQTFHGNKALKKIEASAFDFSNKERDEVNTTFGMYYTFADCDSLEEIEDIGLPPDISINAAYANCGKLKKIEIIRVDENTGFSWSAFQGCESLEYLRFEGVIGGTNSLNLAPCKKLTHESLMSVINALKDFNETIVENYSAESFTDVEMPVSHTLVVGDKYSLTYEGDGFETYTVEATVADIYVMGAGKNALGLEFNMPSQNEGDIPIIWIYNDNGKLMYYSYFSVPNGKITLTKVAADTHTVTLGTTNLNKLSDEEKQIATKKGWSLL